MFSIRSDKETSVTPLLLLFLAGIQQDFTVGTATAPRGQTAYGHIAVPPRRNTGLTIPVAVIHGARAGKVVEFVTGSNGTEYASIVALQRLIPISGPRR